MNKLIMFLFVCFKLYAIVPEGNFEYLMGKNSSSWQYMQTQEDFQNLTFYEDLYEKNSKLLSSTVSKEKIPKMIHFIWLGPKKLSALAKKNMDSWITTHPDWQFFLWTDQKREKIPNKIHQNFVKSDYLDVLQEAYQNTLNFIEKETLLRFMILCKEGGVFIDLAVCAKQKFLDDFCGRFDLFCSLDLPHEPYLSSSIAVSDTLIAAKANHPILQETILQIEKNWRKLTKQFPQDTKESAIYRILYRTFLPFNEAVKKLINLNNNQDIVFPAGFFHKIANGCYADHLISKSWIKFPSTEEEKVASHFQSISRKIQKLYLINTILLVLSMLVILLALGLFFHKKQGRFEH